MLCSLIFDMHSNALINPWPLILVVTRYVWYSRALCVQPVTISARGQGMDLPVFVERETVDLRICTVDRLYQDSLVVCNRYVGHGVPLCLDLFLALTWTLLPSFGSELRFFIQLYESLA